MIARPDLRIREGSFFYPPVLHSEEQTEDACWPRGPADDGGDPVASDNPTEFLYIATEVLRALRSIDDARLGHAFRVLHRSVRGSGSEAIGIVLGEVIHSHRRTTGPFYKLDAAFVGRYVKEFLTAGQTFVDEFARLGGTDADYFAFISNPSVMRKLARYVMRHRERWLVREVELDLPYPAVDPDDPTSEDHLTPDSDDRMHDVPNWKPRKRVHRDVVIREPAKPEIELDERHSDSQETWDDDDYNVVVDYEATPRQLIGKGRYTYVAPELTVHDLEVESSGSGRMVRELVVIQFEEAVSYGQIMATADERGLAMADLNELLTFGASSFDLSHPRPITTFVRMNGKRVAVNLTQDGKARMLTIGKARTMWDAGWRFLTERIPTFSDDDLDRYSFDPDKTPISVPLPD